MGRSRKKVLRFRRVGIKESVAIQATLLVILYFPFIA